MCAETAIFVLPVQSGQTRLAMRLLAEIDAHQRQNGARKAVQAAGLTQVVWYLSVQPSATYLIAQIEGTEPARGFLELMMAGTEVAGWFRTHLAEIGGVELNAPVLGQLMHAPVARIAPDHPPMTERSALGHPNQA